MKNKIYILLIVQLNSEGLINYSMEKFSTAEEAQSEGEKRLQAWMDENDMTEVDCKINRYSKNLVEVFDNKGIAEFDYCVKQFEV